MCLDLRGFAFARPAAAPFRFAAESGADRRMTTGSWQLRSRRITAPAILVGVLTAASLLIATTGWFLWQSGQRALRDAGATTETLVAVLDRHAARMIDSVRIVMTTAGQQLGPDPSDTLRRSFLDGWLADVARGLPHLHSVALVDRRSGAILYDFVRSREAGAGPLAALAEVARADTTEGLRSGKAVLDEPSGRWLLPLSRIVPPRQGVDDTIVVANLSLAYLQEVYDSLSIGANGTVVLLRDDGTILARRPYDASTVGQNIVAGPLFRDHLPNRPNGTFQARSTIDGVDRIISYRRLDATGLVAVVSLSQAEVLARWTQELSSDFLVAGLCAMSLLGLGLMLIRMLRQRDRADAHLRTTLQHMQQGLLMVGPDQRTELYNAKALELLDLPEALMASRPLPAEVFAWQDSQGEFDDLTPEMRDSIVRGALAQTPSCYQRARRNGSVLEIRTTPLPNGGAVRTYTDVTEQRRAIDEMNASVAFANTLVNSSPDCIQLLDLDGHITFISDLGQELFEIEDFESVRGRHFTLLFPEEHRTRVDLALRRVRGGQTDRFIRMCPTLGGVARWWEFIITPVHEIGRESERLFVVARDISERQAHADELSRAKEAAERASQAKTQFLASMSHEIRTPLNAILGFAALARARQGRDPELSRQIGLIEKAGASLLTILNDVLDLAKIEAGKVELELLPLDFAELADDCVALTRGLADQKGLRLDCVFAADFPARIVADEARVRQVLLNLLNNAVKFTPSGTVTLSVARSADGTRMGVCVSDTGIGISQERIAHLFQDFVQVDGSISRHYGGTGLGLSISRRLVELMGGSIGVESVVGEGSRFHFDLPLVEAREDEGRKRRDEAVPAAAIVPRSILLVDDLSINLEIVSEMLLSAGHRVDLADSGPQAITLFRERRHEMILMDVQMPDMDGLETTRRIRDIDEAARLTPIVALTANVFSQQVESYRDAGMNDHLGKPFGRDALLAMVERWSDPEKRPALPPDPPPADPAPAALDRACLDELTQLLGPAKVRELLRRFRTELPDRLRSAASSALRADAHAMISTAGLLGFARLSAAARALEQAVDTGGDVAPPLTSLLAARKAAIATLDDLLASADDASLAA
jgi:PAS domain S-box-containing protein